MCMAMMVMTVIMVIMVMMMMMLMMKVMLIVMMMMMIMMNLLGPRQKLLFEQHLQLLMQRDVPVRGEDLHADDDHDAEVGVARRGCNIQQ